jgi:hypothetical protein
MKDLENRIKYLKQELAARDRQDGWVVEGLRKELERLLKKAVKIK